MEIWYSVSEILWITFGQKENVNRQRGFWSEERIARSWDAVWDESGSTLEYAFDFMEAAFYNSQEMVIFVSGINTDYSCVRFLETYECERYIRYNRDLLFEDASQEIRRRIEEL